MRWGACHFARYAVMQLCSLVVDGLSHCTDTDALTVRHAVILREAKRSRRIQLALLVRCSKLVVSTLAMVLDPATARRVTG